MMNPASSAASNAASGGHHEWKRTWLSPYSFRVAKYFLHGSTSIGAAPVSGHTHASCRPRKNIGRPFSVNCVPFVRKSRRPNFTVADASPTLTVSVCSTGLNSLHFGASGPSTTANSPVDTPHGTKCGNVRVTTLLLYACCPCVTEPPISTLASLARAPSLRNTTFAVTLPSAADGNVFTCTIDISP